MRTTAKIVAPGTKAPPPQSLQAYLLSRHISHGQLARGAGLDRSYITRVCNGKRSVSIRAAGRISSFLGISIDRLLMLLHHESLRAQAS